MSILKTAYLPIDRALALARHETLPDYSDGTALFADISGFTPLTEALRKTLGERRGAEELTRHLNAVYEALIVEVHRYGGSVIGFSGDAITCWFANRTPFSPPPPLDMRLDTPASSPSPALQRGPGGEVPAVQQFAAIPLPDGSTTTLAVKIAIASGAAHRLVVGDPAIQLIDVLAGVTIRRMAAGEALTNSGEILVDKITAFQLRAVPHTREWRVDADSGEHFAVVSRQSRTVAPTPWPSLEAIDLPDALARQWILPAVNAQLDAGVSEFLTELRPAVALFLRFDGIDYESSQSAAALDRFVRWVQAILTRYGGNLLQVTMGDKGSYLYIAFGAPLAHEDDSFRAVSAAYELSRPPIEMNLTVQIGLSQGVIRTGAYGSSLRRTYGVLGDEVNVAARLMQYAPGGAVIISGNVQRQVEGTFSCRALRPLTIKGKAEPVSVAQLTGRRDSASDLGGIRTPLVGREAELQQLRDWIQPIFAGRFAGTIAVYGEAGVGKSQLIFEFRQQLTQQQALTWLSAPVDSILRQSLNPFESMLRGYFDQRSDRGVEGNKARFNQIFDQLLATSSPNAPIAPELLQELERTRPFLAAMLGLFFSGSLYEQLEPRLRLDNTLIGLKTLLLVESRRQPLIVYVEDSQWLDHDSAVFLQSLTRNVADYPLAVIFSSRYAEDGSPPALPLDSGVTQHALELGHLTRESVQTLAEQVLGGPINPGLASFLFEKTNGNPFFVEQMALDLRERHALEANEEGWRLSAASTLELPGEINAFLIARLDRLTAEVRATVQTAAVLGQEFEAHILSQILRQMDTSRLVEQAASEGIWSALTVLRYLFRHALLRDAAYSMQVQTRRRELHQAAAAAIRAVYGPDAVTSYADLAYHYTLAEDVENAPHYALLAAEHHLQASAYYDVQAELERVLKLVGERSGTERLRLRLQATLAQAYEMLSLYGQALACYEQNRRLAESLHDQAELAAALTGMGEIHRGLHQREDSAVYHRQSLAIQRELNNAHGVAKNLSGLGTMAYAQGDYAAASEYHQQSLAIRREIGDLAGVADSLLELGRLAGRSTGDYAASKALLSESLAIRQSLQDRFGIATVLSSLGVTTRYLGNYDEAEHYYRQSLTIMQEIGNRTGAATAMNNLGDLAAIRGDYEAATRYFQNYVRIAQESGLRGVHGLGLLNLGSVAFLRGDLDASEALMHEALKNFEEIRDQHGIMYSYKYLSEVAIARGDWQTARHYSQQSLSIARASDARQGIAFSLGNLARAEANLGHSAAQSTLRDALTMAQTLHIDPFSLGILAAAADVFAALAQPHRAAQLVGLVRAHHATIPEDLVLVNLTRRRLQAVFSDAELDAALQPDQTASLDTLLTDLLNELETD